MANGHGGVRPGAGRKRAPIPKAMIDRATPEILETVIAQATAGDLQACALILARGVQPLRPSLAPVRILTQAQLASMSPAQRADAVNAAALSGKLPADVAASLLDGIAKACAIFESSELEARLAALEEASAND
ncbi:hypothetical protein [Aeromonas caviae]|uniref:hypothetical protein n=1 Tax=Aeromonas caviae TaxID=648 RepID=UPI0038D01866